MYHSVAQANYALDEAQARSAGHKVEVICTWMIEDDADFHAECKNKECGWKSRDTRDSGSAWNYGRQHIKEVAASLRQAPAAAQ
jgi:hypothetical protein